MTRLWLVLLWLGTAPLAAQAEHETWDTFRHQLHLSAASWDAALSQLCQARASALASAGVLEHTTDGRSAAEQSLLAGYPPGVFGEVLGAGPSWDAVWRAWLASPAHRAVLSDPVWTKWGWGRATVGDTTVWVLRFWAP